VRDAVVLLGLSNVRARMAQMLARTLGVDSPDAAFTIGLFSNLGVLLGIDLESATRSCR
jgi:c-di-GMP-related signal transduction protein